MFFVSLLALAGAVQYTPEQLRGEITALPGLSPKPTFRMFSGYIPVDKAQTRQLFYWFVEAESAPETAPVLLWTNGGPGCSGLGGFMSEQGPFRPNADGTLKYNQYAWNKIANVIFIEQPAGVGFSIAPQGYRAYNDANSAADNYAFIKGWFAQFPQFSTNRFYTTSESYGGHYIPTLAKYIVDKGDVPNFKGFAVGNPLTYMPYRDYGQYGTYAGHNLLPLPLWNRYLAEGCKDDDSQAACQDLMAQMDALTTGLDPYALDFPVCNDQALATGRNQRAALLRTLQRAGKHQLKGYFPEDYEACASDWGAKYLSRPDVQAAIRVAVPTDFQWQECDMLVNSVYNLTDVNAAMMPYYQYLIQNAKLDILVYSGDNDAVCATLGSQQWIWGLGASVVSEWAPWVFEGQTAGYLVKFAGFNFATVHGAGHMVPQTRPAQSLELLGRYLNGKL